MPLDKFRGINRDSCNTIPLKCIISRQSQQQHRIRTFRPILGYADVWTFRCYVTAKSNQDLQGRFKAFRTYKHINTDGDKWGGSIERTGFPMDP